MSASARPSPQHAPALLADVGGTHARFTLLAPDGAIATPVILPSEAFHDLAAPAQESLSLLRKPLPAAFEVRQAAVAVAGPVVGDRVELTNVGWSFSIEETRRALGLERLVVVNDLAALAWAVPALASKRRQDEKAFIEGKDQRLGSSDSVTAVVAVGTGLGAATHVRSGGVELVLASEAGHADLAATSSREWAVVERLSTRFPGHVSVERAVSGGGLANLWAALAELEGEFTVEAVAPEAVTARAAAGERRALEAVALFSGWLGAFAGDFALAVGARGGLWLGGGVLAGLGELFDRKSFTERFLAKGRFEDWMGGVAVRPIDDPLAAFRGLARRLSAGEGHPK